MGEAPLQKAILLETQESLQLDLKGSVYDKHGALLAANGRLSNQFVLFPEVTTPLFSILSFGLAIQRRLARSTLRSPCGQRSECGMITGH